MDTLDGVLMTGAYGWAFRRPVRKVYYNLTITAISVAVALVIGTIELVGVLADQIGIQHGPLAAVAAIPLDHAGYVDRRPLRRRLGRGARRLALRPHRGTVVEDRRDPGRADGPTPPGRDRDALGRPGEPLVADRARPLRGGRDGPDRRCSPVLTRLNPWSLLAMLFVPYGLQRSSRRAARVRLTPDGVEVRGLRTRLYPYADIASVEVAPDWDGSRAVWVRLRASAAVRPSPRCSTPPPVLDARDVRARTWPASVDAIRARAEAAAATRRRHTERSVRPPRAEARNWGRTPIALDPPEITEP